MTEDEKNEMRDFGRSMAIIRGRNSGMYTQEEIWNSSKTITEMAYRDPKYKKILGKELDVEDIDAFNHVLAQKIDIIYDTII